VPDGSTGRAVRLGILSYSNGVFDARSFRVARSAIAAGYEVTMYCRWSPGQALTEERDGYRLVRVPATWQLAVPGLRGGARRRIAREVADSEALAATGFTDNEAPEPLGPKSLSIPERAIRKATRGIRRWRRLIYQFPLNPMGWGVAVAEVAAPADVWHGMWAGSLPALARLRRRDAARAIYDSRDVYMRSRDYARLFSPLRAVLAEAERRWARRMDGVLTVNEPYADLLVDQLGVARPAIVVNCPERWTPPDPRPDLLRAATGVPADTRVVLYQGQLIGERGIEQAMDAILAVPGAVLCLLGFGSWEARFRAAAAEPRYRGRVFVLPAVTPDQLLAWTASADVMLMPIQPTTTNHRFTTPQKLWEAMAAGVPVVASDLPGMATVVRETGTGELCDPEDPASIAAAIRRVLERPADEREALREHALRVAHEQYNWESQAGLLLGLYASLLHQQGSGAA
jgi:glycogen synthase